MEYSLEKIWNLNHEKLVEILGEDFKNIQKLKTKVSIKLYNEEKLDKKSDKIVETDNYYKIMKKASSLKIGLNKLKGCELNDYDSDDDLIDPVTMEKIKDENIIMNERRCYDKKTLKKIIIEGDGKDPYTRNDFPREITKKFKKYEIKNGVLDLSDMDLTEIPDDLPSNIDSLNLSNNRIKKIENNLFRHSTISDLNLSNNKIKKIDRDSFSSLILLENLDLSYNEIEEIENNFFNYPFSIENLNLSNNKIKKIEKNTFNGLPLLFTLDLSDNKIKEIEEGSFNKLFKITEINLSGNGLKNFAKGKRSRIFSTIKF